MLELPVLRWGEAYESLDKVEVKNFETGEVLAQVHQATGGILKMDMRKAQRARDVLRKIPPADLIAMCKQAGEFYLNDTLEVGSGTQTPAEFCQLQSASTGLPVNMCKANMAKCAYVLKHMDEILDALTRGLPLEILARGYGEESRGVTVSYQATTPILGCVLPSNSPGVHTLWLPAIPMQIGLVLKPGSTEPWTPYRMAAAFTKAGVPKEAIALYPGPHEVGGAITEVCRRSMIFGSEKTVQQYSNNPKVQVHGPGFSKIIFGEDAADRWEDYLDLMAASVFANSGRSCINASSIFTPKHGAEIADALAQRLGPITPKAMDDPDADLSAFTTEGVAAAFNGMIEDGLKTSGATEVTAKYRDGDRLVEKDTHDFLRPTIVHCTSPEHPLAKAEYMFPFASVVDCPQKDILKKIGPTLVGTAITDDEAFKADLLDALHIDRLNIGPVPTVALHWMQPHEGNIVEFLYRNRAFQTQPPPKVA
ncbi:aldehyde dehydrogenase family protein [Stratiformator vulcanicus]|uniref:Succinate-semialdehyde dehydrogenase [NADP(+)] 2 n=1 Tax=Stratiformator vulcanicus TaxID=2527980 RepID=A0A517QVU9_9PLAN|nr:aldehyde dehydrogenase family protein [Stratiformator vulcanicus]QDT35740.1 Putative succinate-semialdehyde dehydrogenase [NADP(+)] 2 [Stratiformator vulcanicus]